MYCEIIYIHLNWKLFDSESTALTIYYMTPTPQNMNEPGQATRLTRELHDFHRLMDKKQTNKQINKNDKNTPPLKKDP